MSRHFENSLLTCSYTEEIKMNKKKLVEKFHMDSVKIPASTCCWRFHIRTGAIFVFILEGLGLTSQLYRTLETYLLVSNCSTYVGNILLLILITLICWNFGGITCVLAATIVKKHQLLIPKLIFQIFSLCLLLTVILYSCLYFLFSLKVLEWPLEALYESTMVCDNPAFDYYDSNVTNTTLESTNFDDSEVSFAHTLFGLLLYGAGSIVVEFWFFWILYNYYDFLKFHNRRQKGNLLINV